MLNRNMLTEEEHNVLRLKYNPEGSILRKAQLRMLDMLIYIDKICRENNLLYWLEGGNLLGAVRHKGFIPWDDDTDIYMPIKDMKQLKKIVLLDTNSNYIWHDHDTDSNELCFWATLRDKKSEYIQEKKSHKIKKYRGLQVDIFPVELGILHLPTKLADLTHNMLPYIIDRYPKYDFPIAFAKVLFSIERNIVFPLFRMFGKCFNKKDEYSNSYGVNFGFYPKDWIFPLTDIEFEGHMFFAPHDYKKYLKKKYGEDCFEMPAKDKIVTHEVEILFR